MQACLVANTISILPVRSMSSKAHIT
jgi:hypothetical protein